MQTISSEDSSPLAGLSLPGAWRGLPRWRVLALGDDSAFGFLKVWQAWRTDPDRPRMLHYVALLPAGGEWPRWPRAGDPSRQAPEVDADLAREVNKRCRGLTPGVHRLDFDSGCVLLTLCIGDQNRLLREQRFAADSIWLAGPDAASPGFEWDAAGIKVLAKCCRRGTRLAGLGRAPRIAALLDQNGFMAAPRETAGRADERTNAFVFDPTWTPRTRRDGALVVRAASDPCADVVVIGAGLAGAAVAASLARRGHRVCVLDQADRPAAGASGLPAGLFAPHVSADDALLSRLSRAGIRSILRFARDRLAVGEDWRMSGVLELRADAKRVLAGRGDGDVHTDWTRLASRRRKAAAGVAESVGALWHRRAGWIKPAALIHALLADRSISFEGGAQVARLGGSTAGWQALDSNGRLLAEAPIVVIAAGHESGFLAGNGLPLQPVRGQLSWGPLVPAATATGVGIMRPSRSFPVNGNGSYIPEVPLAGGSVWIAGATFDRDQTTVEERARDHDRNFGRLRQLLPDAATWLAPQFARGEVNGWAGIRCTAPDRLPVVGPVAPEKSPGLWISTAMGSRGLSFALLCAELLAARLCGEPLPLPARIAKALDARRFLSRVSGSGQ